VRGPDRAALTGILFVLKTSCPWQALPTELGCGSGSTCWRRLRDWQAAGVWDRLHRLLLDRLGSHGRIVPAKLHADKAYDFVGCRAACRKRGITPRIARRGIESEERLGRYRWMVEWTLAWLARFRRLTVRYERRADMHLTLTTLACALVCWNRVRTALV
jgi:transposase